MFGNDDWRGIHERRRDNDTGHRIMDHCFHQNHLRLGRGKPHATETTYG